MHCQVQELSTRRARAIFERQAQNSQAILGKGFHKGFRISFSDSEETVVKSTKAGSSLYTDQQFANSKIFLPWTNKSSLGECCTFWTAHGSFSNS